MADAQDSKSCEGNFMWVRLPPSAPKNKKRGLYMKKICSLFVLGLCSIFLFTGCGGNKYYTAPEIMLECRSLVGYGSSGNELDIAITDSQGNLVALDSINYAETVESIYNTVGLAEQHWNDVQSNNLHISGETPAGTQYEYNYDLIENGFTLNYTLENFSNYNERLTFKDNYLKLVKTGEDGSKQIDMTIELFAVKEDLFIQLIDNADNANVKIVKYYYDKKTNKLSFDTNYTNHELVATDCSDFVIPQLEYTITKL